MEEEDDDFYGGGVSNAHDIEHAHAPPNDGAVKMETSDGQDDEEEEEDSDDDVQFTLEKPDGAQESSATTSRTAKQQDKLQPTDSKPKPERTSTPEPRPSQPPTTIKAPLTHAGKEGKAYPAIQTSTLDINAIPTWPATGKPITQVDIDADLAENSKPWRLPGTDQTDFFNYGFDEYTWAQYCFRQQNMAEKISEQKAEDAQIKAMFDSGGASMPPMPGGGGGGGQGGMPPGMPGPEQVMQQMMAQGYDPSDQNQFMQFMAQNFGGGGPGQGMASPHPQSGQGFQPPSGPAADQGGFQGGMDGYGQQMGMGQGFQGGRGRGRGRGRY